MAQRKRGSLSPRIPSAELMTALGEAALQIRRSGQRLLTPEVLLLALILGCQKLILESSHFRMLEFAWD